LVPITVISSEGSFQTRFACAKAGADGFMQKPIDIPRLVDRLDQFRQHSEEAPFRILIIDDDELLAAHFQLVLEHAGMEALALSDPSQALDLVKSFRPELILLDLYMPDYPGADLARTIRQDDDWLAVPIVYLSSERDIGVQLSAMTRGGDDFLTKPISDKNLVTAVRIRALRARALSDLMYRDSLTGLLKHARIKDQLVVECERAKREDEALCAAMLDIDHFKKVNDTYGHAIGDRVIKALAQLLKQRARKTDILGRYGGEEFAVILPGCDIEMAMKILEDIRERFSRIEFAHPGGTFSATLSGGVAQLSEKLSGQSLLAAADEALYRSKQAGRNLISAV
jgi:diguanylate cyclase (GGDEF)-like protein